MTRTGDYILKLFYCDQLIPRCPITGSVEKPPPPPPVVEKPPAPPAPAPLPPVIIVEQMVCDEPKPCPAPQPPPPAPPQPRIYPQNVQVIGPGLVEARVGETAEFLLDASAAGPGRNFLFIAKVLH